MMDFNGRLQSTYAGSAAAYAMQDGMGRAQRDASPSATRSARVVAADSYTPTEATGIAPEASQSVRQSAGAGELWNCYCGTCSTCRSGGAEKAQLSAAQTDQSMLEKPNRSEADATPPNESTDAASEGSSELTEAEKEQVKKLKQRDQEVRAHEQAHAAAGGRNVRYSYQAGPDGRQYAVGGTTDVAISFTSGDHGTKMAKARQMRAAALAPADPSAQDMAVAARATRIEMEARAEQADKQSEGMQENAGQTPANGLATPTNGSPQVENPFFAVA